MKFKFSKDVDYIPTFNGNRDLPEAEQFRTKLKIMEMGEFLALADALQSANGGKKDVDSDKLTIDQIKPLLEDAGHLLPKYVTIFNLLDDDNNAIGPGDIAATSVFIPLAAELLVQLTQVSMPKGQDEKN